MTFQYCFDGSIKKVNNLSVSSPRTWGCFQSGTGTASGPSVFPTHVGVFLLLRSCEYDRASLPHARGGVSEKIHPGERFYGSSPRTWGCFSSCPPRPFSDDVFPTHVGVFPCNPIFQRAVLKSSPRTWGCFQGAKAGETPVHVFPTHVGVFLELIDHMPVTRRLPHARGGVSNAGEFYSGICVSSPRTWGCFLDCRSCVDARKVFPTHVGVFPGRGRHCRSAPCLPHARGGVSLLQRRWLWPSTSSPRTWGCF